MKKCPQDTLTCRIDAPLYGLHISSSSRREKKFWVVSGRGVDDGSREVRLRCESGSHAEEASFLIAP